MKKINIITYDPSDDTGAKKIPVKTFDVDLTTGKISKEHESYLWADEETDCVNFHNHDGTGAINTCIGNEPYSCHRAKKEGLCHKVKRNG